MTNWGSESRGSESWGSTREVGEGASEAASEAKELR